MPAELDIVAVTEGDVESVRAALAGGADINQPLGKLGAALHFAVKYDREAIVDLLLESGADPNARDEQGRTALMQSILPGILMRPNPRALERLVAAGTDLDARDNGGRTALILAAERGSDSRAEAIIAANVALSQVLRSRPSVAEFMKFLIDAGADMQLSDDEGNNALTWAFWLDKPQIVALLREAGCAERRVKELSLIKTARTGELAEVTRSIESGADVNAGSPELKQTALMVAAYGGHLEVVQTLLKSGADPNAKDGKGEVALMYASAQGHLEIVKALVAAGADPAYSTEDSSVLETAQLGNSGRAHREVVNYLRHVLKDSAVVSRYRAKRGIETFDMDGDFLLLKVPVTDAAEALTKLHPGGTWKRDVFDKQVELGDPSFVAFQFDGHAWTLIAQLTGEPALRPHGPALSAAMQRAAIYFEASDTAGAFGYRLYDNGKLVESFDLGDNGPRFTSDRRDVKLEQVTNWQEFASEFMRQQDAYIPGFAIRYTHDATGTATLSLPCTRDDLIRMDYVSA